MVDTDNLTLAVLASGDKPKWAIVECGRCLSCGSCGGTLSDMDNRRFVSDLNEEFLKRMREARGAARMKQSDVVKQLAGYGVSMGPSTYAKIERGERKLDFAEAFAIAQVLKFPFSDMAPNPIDPAEQIARLATSLIGLVHVARDDAADAMHQLDRICRARNRLREIYEESGHRITDDTDRYLVEELLRDDVGEGLLGRLSELQRVVDYLATFEKLDLEYKVRRHQRDEPEFWSLDRVDERE